MENQNKNRGINGFFSLLTVLLLILLLASSFRGCTFSDTYKEIGSKGVLIEKHDDFFVGKTFYIKDENNEVHFELVWEIDYIKYNVGDTIK